MNREIDVVGRIVIPKEMRNKINLKNGDRVEMTLIDDKIIVTNPNLNDPFADWLKEAINNNHNVDLNTILDIYYELKK